MAGVAGKMFMHGYGFGFGDVLFGEFSIANLVVIQVGEGRDTIFGLWWAKTR